MFKNFRKGDAVTGRYFGIQFAGTVRNVRINERTKLDEIEIDFPAPIAFRGPSDIRTGLILTNLGEDDELKKAPVLQPLGAGPLHPGAVA